MFGRERRYLLYNCDMPKEIENLKSFCGMDECTQATVSAETIPAIKQNAVKSFTKTNYLIMTPTDRDRRDYYNKGWFRAPPPGQACLCLGLGIHEGTFEDERVLLGCQGKEKPIYFS